MIEVNNKQGNHDNRGNQGDRDEQKQALEQKSMPGAQANGLRGRANILDNSTSN